MTASTKQRPSTRGRTTPRVLTPAQERERKRQQRTLRRAIKLSGLSNRFFAELVLARDERTLRRWLNDETMLLSRTVVARLEAYIAERSAVHRLQTGEDPA